MTNSGEIFEWLELLDHLDYYEVLRVERDVDVDAVHAAYQAFAAAFHPDAHVARTDDERDALDHIFKRGTEAYAVLGDPVLRAHYDEALSRALPSEPPRIPELLASRGAQSGKPPAPQRLEDQVKNPTVRPFARRAEELAEAGDFRQAKLHLSLARMREPENSALAAYLDYIESRLKR